MKVLRLQMRGLRSHRTETTIDLADRELVALVGPTGAGKSSILEGLCFALFGESTSGGSGRGGSALAELSSDGRTPISVRLELSVGGVRYQLTRSVVPPTGKATSWLTRECWVHQLDADGRTVKSWEQTTKVNDQIRRLLGGLSREQFCQSVMLPQNRFAALIEAVPDERNKLLDNLLGLTALRTAATVARERVKLVDYQVDLLRTERDGLDPDPAVAAARAHERAEVDQCLHDAAVDAATTLAGLASEHDLLRGTADRFRALATAPTQWGPAGAVAHQLAARFEGLSSTARALQAAEDCARERATDASAAAAAAAIDLAAVERECGSAVDHAHTGTALVTYGAAQNELPGLRSRVTSLQLDLEKAAATALALRTSAGRVVADEEEADAAAKKTREAAHKCELLLDGHRRRHDGARNAAARALAADVAAAKAVVAAGLAADEAKVAQEKAAGAADALASAHGRLADARRMTAAAAAASGCHPGDGCPICSRELPAAWRPPVDTGLAAAERSASEADLAQTAAAKASATATSEAGRMRLAAETAAREASEAADAMKAAARAAGLEEPVLDAGALAVWERAAADILAAAEAEADELEAAATEAARAAGAVAILARKAANAAAEAETNRATAEVRLEGARSSLTDAEGRREESRQHVLPRWQALLAQGVDVAVAALARDKNALKLAADSAEDARRVSGLANDAVRDARNEVTGQVVRPAAKALGQLVDLTAVISQIGFDLGEPINSSWNVPSPDESVDAEVLVAASRIADAAEVAVSSLVCTASSKAASASDAAAALVSQGALLVESLAAAVVASRSDDDGDDDYVEQLTVATEGPLSNSTISLVGQVVGNARKSVQQARQDEQRFLAQQARAAEIDARLAGLQRWRADLHGAVDILDRNAFPAYARRIRTAELAQVASDHLGRMSADRYLFEDDLRVRDGHTGAVRSASTLSGGEKFQASLSLALAVAEIAGRAGVKLETLFLDEGFSGLDSRSLHLALDAIEAEVAAGRSIVLITHIGAVAQRVEDVFLVEPDGVGGCRTSWLDDAKRYELGADLDLVT